MVPSSKCETHVSNPQELVYENQIDIDNGATGGIQPLERARALVIGNSAYPGDAALANPVNDATAMAKALQDLGFEVQLSTDLNLRDMTKSISAFATTVQPTTKCFSITAATELRQRDQLLIP
jgi:hypothetical protein